MKHSRMHRPPPTFLLPIVALLWLAAPVSGDGLLPPLTEPRIQQARKLLAEFKSNPKGPYLRIRWFCNDGSVHPPSPPPCASRGGGAQHAELSPAALRLAEWNIDVGTILAGLDFESFADAGRDHHRLKQLILEKYLTETDDGWIYRRARSYRGARQVEDEEKAGRRLLTQLFSDPAWLARNDFLAMQLIDAVPHGTPDSIVLRVRTLAKVIADRDARFQPIRNQIHSTPSPADRQAVKRFLAERNPAEPIKAELAELSGLLEKQDASQTLSSKLPAFQKKLASSPVAARLADVAAALRQGNQDDVFVSGAALSIQIRQAVSKSNDGKRNLDLLDLNASLLEHTFRSSPAAAGGATRRKLLANLRDHFRYATGAGLLSFRQLDALDAEIQSLERSPEATTDAYYQSIRYLARSTEWCRATAVKDFAPVLRQYQEIESAAAGLVDHLLRGSIALPLSSRMDALVADANRAAGIRHFILGEGSNRGVVAMNPGVAVGRLGILTSSHKETDPIDPDWIYVIPETLADLKPMAGILTLDSGNALSHAQLLAANLGIPNATVPSSLLPFLAKHAGQEIFFGVTPRGVVVLRNKETLSPAELKVWVERPAANKPRIDLDTRRVNLAERRVLDLKDLRTKDSGVTVGPKAANLAELAAAFPEQVAPALVIPFGVYAAHVNRMLEGNVPLQQEISAAFTQAERMRDAGTAPAEVARFIYPKLARFRKLIQSMPLDPGFEKELLARMRAKFGSDGSYGLFVRSDTNAEDLPEFTGAGLNLTVPNQVGQANIIQAIKNVWASPFAERAYDWRRRILRSSEHVYPSVVLMRAVPSDKSGVIGTVNLETGDTDEITVNVSEGVSAVVDGGVAESLLLEPDGKVRLLHQARCPYKKVVAASGGLVNRPASGSDSVLTPDEIAQLRRLVAEVNAKYPAAKSETGQTLPWDIEFGFEKGQLRLFQIRPLVRYQELSALEALGKLEARPEAPGPVRLDEAL